MNESANRECLKKRESCAKLVVSLVKKYIVFGKICMTDVIRQLVVVIKIMD